MSVTYIGGRPGSGFSAYSPLRLWARELRGVAGRGASEPLRVQCVSDDGERHNVIVKLRNPQVPDLKPWGQCLVRDLIGAILARRLGLNVPPYAIVTFDDVFIRATSRHPLAGRIQANRGSNFGSIQIDSVLEGVHGSRDEWAATLAFDALGFNADRKASNPNVLWTGEKLYLIDHGLLAPTWTFHLDGTTNSSLYGSDNIRLHAGFEAVRGFSESFGLAQHWKAYVTDDFLTWLRTMVPDTWASGLELDALFDFLRARHPIADRQEIELAGVTQ